MSTYEVTNLQMKIVESGICHIKKGKILIKGGKMLSKKKMVIKGDNY